MRVGRGSAEGSREGGKPGEREKRRRDVHRAHQARDDASPRHSGTPQNQRNPQHGVVQSIGVGGFAVLAEALPVVRRHQNERFPPGRSALEAIEQPAELLVDVGDLAIVGARGKALGERRRGAGGTEKRGGGGAGGSHSRARSVTSAASRSRKPPAPERPEEAPSS